MSNIADKAMMSAVIVLWLGAALAQPKNTLPPGFHSTPLDQPAIEEEAEEKSSETEQPIAEADQTFLPLLARDLLLPPITGLIDNKRGLGEDIWLEGDIAVIEQLLADWQVNIDRRPVAQLARRFLLTEARTPPTMDNYRFMMLRLEKLYQLGDLKSMRRLFDLYPALTSQTEFLLLYQKMILAQYALSGNAVGEGCALWRVIQPRLVQANSDDGAEAPLAPLALQMRALCLGIAGQSGRALAQAERLSDSGQAPRAFFPLLARALDRSRASTNAPAYLMPDKISNILWALYKSIKKRPRAISIKHIDAALLPMIAQDRSLPYGWRLAAAQRAMQRAIVSPRFLQQFYQRAETPPDANAFRPPLRRARSKSTHRAQVQRIANILAAAPTRSAFMASLYSWARDIAFLNPQSGHRRVDGLRAALLLNNAELINTWLGGGESADTPSALRAMMLILEHAKRSVHRGVSPQAVRRWQVNTDLLIKMIGAEFFDIAASALPDADDTEEGDAIIEAAAQNAQAEVILRVLVGMDNPALARSPAFLRAVIQGLNRVGLKHEAWQIAVDSFLLEAWGA